MKKTLSSLGLTIGLFCSLTALKAQETYSPGYAILSDGSRVSGKISFYADAPWTNQRYILLKDSASLAESKSDNVKPKKYRVDDLKSYQTGDRKFEKVHYVDTENLQLKSLGSNDHMMEKLSGGRIDVYRYYSYPKDFDIYYGDYKEKMAKDHKELMNGWKMLSQKDNDKMQNAFDYDLQKYFADTPDVLKKFQNGEYGNEPVSTKKGLAARMISMAKKAALMPMQYETLVAAFNDYNQKNPTKK